MGDGARLAIAILILFLAMIAFFFAFHPGGVEGATGPINNPGDILKFMFNQFDSTANGTSAQTGPEGDGGTTNVGGTTQAPGTNTAGGRG